ncbi:P-loop containing nucleoside triphosphate hydrolase protein [Aspergillus avenaceus]|uniref:P-loop containing nucleoside triphosphate hydrolase protein n=1 Tax=Aspergillus avenaceus TaxID=36643 RepID=A0A5N6TY36_ASPAV|nr:P-loop containing nucleoside triphosphate hydrolase protein [Aspergillus avenaceus]
MAVIAEEPVSDNDSGERPVRNKLKETSITAAPMDSATDVSTQPQQEGETSRSSSRGRKRSFNEESENPNEDDGGHRRKRSRDSKNEDEEDSAQTEAASELPRKILSPKKKRSRDQLDKESKTEGAAGDSENKTSAEEGSSETAAGEPEKKRHRDASKERDSDSATSAFANTSTVSPFGALGASKPKEEAEKAPAATSSSAFAASSLSAFAGSEQSPFGAIGASTPSVFKSPATEAAKPAATGFASAAGTSGFAALGSGFSGFSGGFGSGGLKGGLTSFAAPGGPSIIGSTSKDKPFGAAEEEKLEEEKEEIDIGPGEFEQDKTDERFFERPIETGEEEEKTYFSSKAKLFQFSNREWKERGIGTFKVNVKITDGKEDKKATRLIMRADGVLRVMLNTPIFKGMTVGDASGNEPKSKQIHLASLEDDRSVPILLRPDSKTQGNPKQKNATSNQQENPKQGTKKRINRKQGPRKPTGPWPETFKKLSRTHRALNLVYTFCCTRKHFATTFENIKKAVQGQVGGELTVEEVARVRVVVPRAVRFEYVDEAGLEVMTVGEREVVEIYGRGYRCSAGEDVEGDGDGGGKVLLFEFVDGDLKRENTRGESTKRKMKDEELRMPVYSQKQMLGLIEKRNKKFSDAVDAFLVGCEEEGVDPVAKLESEKDAFIPVPPCRVVSAVASAPRQIPKDRKSMSEIIGEIREMDWYSAQIVPEGHRVFEPQPAVYGDLDFALSQDLVNALYNTRGIAQFYSHQAEAVNALYEGHNVIVSTSTSSGKSLIYQVPMLHELEHDHDSRGLYIFPTKALAQDQRRSMKDLLHYMDGLQDTMVETFDGDTPMENRNVIRDEARIIFTNPDMLHITILPQESSWRTFLKNLKFVVVDELHVYNGLFGSHVAFIMRRLRRICAAVGNRHVRFISCSATVANPEEHMKAVFGVDDVRLIDFDGSPSGRKEFICWNTPFKDPGDPTSGRGDSVAETARLFCQLILRGARVIAFCRIRKLCEVLLQAVRTEFQNLERPDIGQMVMGYRGGYSPQDRRRIEKEMFDGQLMGIVATNALELGVDIGSLDAVVTLGFPYSISNLRQQSGRAGRRNKDSLSVLVGDRYPTDQYYMRSPDELFTKPNCALQVDLSNELILEGHIQCAAFEMPIRPAEDTIYFGPQLSTFAATRLTKDLLGFYHCHARFRPHPSRCVSIRDTEDHHFAVIDTTNARNTVLEEVEASRAFFTIYEGGIFLHQGQTYLVKELNPDRRFARVLRVHVDWNTLQRDYTDIDPLETETSRPINPMTFTRAYYGSVRIHAVVYGFFKIDKRGRILDAVAVDNPPIDITTKGMWLDVPARALQILQSHNLNIPAAIHAAEHAVLSLLPSFVISSPGDVRTECKVAKKELNRGLANTTTPFTQFNIPTNKEIQLKAQKILNPPSRKRPARLTFYDAKGGSCGSGIAGKAFEFIDTLLERAVQRIEACECVMPRGCIGCVCDERCKEMNEVMSKAGAGVVLRCLLGWEVDVDSLPWGVDDDGEGELAGGLETFVLVS